MKNELKGPYETIKRISLM